MPNYQQTTVTGESWTRCHTVTIHNALAGVPAIAFSEERVTVLAGETLHRWTDTLRKDFDMAGSFPLLDPVTNAATGQSMTHAALYIALYSLYMQTAAERDTPPQEPPTP